MIQVMIRVLFLQSYSDAVGSYRAGWEATIAAGTAKQLIDSGVAVAADPEQAADKQPPATTVNDAQADAAASTATRRGRQPRPKQKSATTPDDEGDSTPPADGTPATA